MKEIANTRLLVSVQHCYDTSANLEVFDVSRKERVKKIYSNEEVLGSITIIKSMSELYPRLGTGYGDVAYNPRRSVLSAIPVGREITYHFYNFTTSKADNVVKLIRKSRWHSQHRTTGCNY